MRYLLVIFFLCFTALLNGQNNFTFNKRNVNVDSVFFKRSNALYHYSNNIDSAIFATKKNVDRATLIYIKAVKLSAEEKWKESNLLLKFCMSHGDSLNALARLKIQFFYGFNLVSMNQIYEGIQYMSKADSSAVTYGDSTIVLNIKAFYADVNRNIGRLDRAKEILDGGMPYLKNGVQAAQLGFIKVYVSTLNQLAVEKKDLSFAFQANAITDTLLDGSRHINDQLLYGALMAEKGSSLSILKKHLEAIQYFEKARLILTDIYPAGAFNQEINLFHEYYNLQDYKKIISYGEKILQRFDEFKELSGRKIEIYQRLSDAYEETGNDKMALYHTHQLINEKEKADQLKYSKEVAELEEKYKASQKDEEIRIANIEKKASEQDALVKQKHLRYTIFACIIVLVLLLVAIVLAFQFNLARNRIQQQALDLETNNRLLDEAIKEKDFLFKELHHRVKNNIQLIISFMKLQYKYAATTSLEEFIREIENKMNAMALVHEKLYKENTQDHIEVKEYIEDISNYVLDSINNADNIPDINVSGVNTKIPIEKAIPIGLIINEAITNSVKYAFTSLNKEPQIDIHLQTNNNNLYLSIKDNGRGFPANFDPEKTTSLGTKAILLLAKQIHANTSWTNNEGAQWTLVIPLNKQ